LKHTLGAYVQEWSLTYKLEQIPLSHEPNLEVQALSVKLKGLNTFLNFIYMFMVLVRSV
jgi:hypothetical protein